MCLAILMIPFTGNYFTSLAITSEPAPKANSSSKLGLLDVSRLKAQYIDLLPTGKTDWPKHKLALLVAK